MSRRRLALALAIVTPLGFATKLTDVALVSGCLSGVLYVVFWILLVLLFRPQLNREFAALAVLLVTCALEFLQLWHPPLLETIRGTFLGHTLLGSWFTWWDFPCYAIGAALGLEVAGACRA
ncbi:MAG: ribosomal maturation YjgA family protein [Planctomycetota bacterium]